LYSIFTEGNRGTVIGIIAAVGAVCIGALVVAILILRKRKAGNTSHTQTMDIIGTEAELIELDEDSSEKKPKKKSKKKEEESASEETSEETSEDEDDEHHFLPFKYKNEKRSRKTGSFF